jgi:hypothetical protein
MTIPNNIVPTNISNILTERNQIWDMWKASQADAEQLNAQSSRISQQVTPQPVSPLSQEKTPPAELRAVLPPLNNALTFIDQTNVKIAEHQEAIKKIKQVALILNVSLIVVIIIALAFAAHTLNLF